MASLFDKFKTLVKANIPGRRSPYGKPSPDSYVSSAEIEKRLEWMEKQSASEDEQTAQLQSVDTAETTPAPQAESQPVAPSAQTDISRARKSVESAGEALDSAEAQIDALPTGMSEAVHESAEKANALIEKARAFIEENSAESVENELPETLGSETSNSDDALDSVKRRLG